jgi:hypothetical protein
MYFEPVYKLFTRRTFLCHQALSHFLLVRASFNKNWKDTLKKFIKNFDDAVSTDNSQYAAHLGLISLPASAEKQHCEIRDCRCTAQH